MKRMKKEDGEEVEADADADVDVSELSKQELCDRLKTLLEGDDIIRIKSEVEAIKQAFIKSKVETDLQRAEFIDKGEMSLILSLFRQSWKKNSKNSE